MAETPVVDLSVPPPVVNGYAKIGFDRLASFPFVVLPQPKDPKAPRLTGLEQVPDLIKQWNGKKVVVSGFMLPTKMDKGLITEFMLMKDQSSCCFGASPAMNDLVIVKLKKPVPYVADKVVSVPGLFKISAAFDPFGFMMGIYHLDADKVEVAD